MRSFKLKNHDVNTGIGFDIKKVKEGNKKESEKMIMSLLPFINKKSKINGKINEDLLQELVECTLTKAIDNFSLEKGVKFITFLSYVLNDCKIEFLNRYHNSFKSIKIEDLKYDIGNYLNTDNLEKECVKKFTQEDIRKIVNQNLFGRDKKIIKDYFFKEKTLAEISEELDISYQRVDQLLKRTQKNLKNMFRYNGILDNFKSKLETLDWNELKYNPKEIIKLLDKYTINKLSRELNVTHRTIRRLLNKNGYKYMKGKVEKIK